MIPTHCLTDEEIAILCEIVNRCGLNIEDIEYLKFLKKNFLFTCINNQSKFLTQDGIKITQEAVNKINANHCGSI